MIMIATMEALTELDNHHFETVLISSKGRALYKDVGKYSSLIQS